MNEQLHLLPDARRTGRQPVRAQAQSGADEAPLRAEVFSAAQMAVHGRQLAARHELAHEDTPDRLLVRLAANAAVVKQACAALARAGKNKQALAPAADALLDDYHLVAEHVRSARHQLPPACSRALPRLAGGAPRVYQLALEVVTHGDGRLEQESLARFVAAYQEGAPLKLVELRTFPVMLRLALVDNLRRIAARLDARRVEHELAEGWAERLVATSSNRPGDLVLLVADMARAVQPLGAGFVADLARRLRGGGAALAQVLEWIGARLADEGSSIAAHIQLDSASQAADAASIANSLASLRLVAAIDWHDFVETMSAVEATLRQDPAGVHAHMDGATRAHYRHAVERLARQSRHGEAEVAAEALALAHAQPVAAGADGRMRHVGYYLVGAGLPALRARLRMRAGVLAGLRRAARRRPLLSWLGAVGGFTLLFVAALLVHAWIDGAGMPLLLALALLSAFGASQLALSLVNAMTARLVRPQPLARMDFGAGIPHDAQTLVVVPALLDSAETVAALAAGLEVGYLANRDPRLRFCLLGDFADAPQETMFEDAELLEGARGAIAALNARHGDGQAAPFLLLQRPRTWSGTEGAWIGRERKRGKLADLNAFLRGGARERFVLAEGNLDGLDQIRYVIALDPDTQLPRGAARQLVAAMAHPLNRPLLNPSGSRVIAGHGLLQPRVTTSLPVDDASRYERLCGGEPGIDLYAHTAPDVYQDLFGQGAWLGKGIYEVDTFERVLGARLPEGRVLAHAPLEDVYLRSGLASDVQVYEAYPARYSDDIVRRHRRIRGAWQLAGWLRARVPAPGGGREANPLPPLARWKLFDALRRSLVAPTLVATLLLCWSLLPEPAFWSAAALAVFFLPAFLGMFAALGDKPHDMLWRQHLANWWRGARGALGHAVMSMSFLPHEAWYSVDAIARSGWRMIVSKRRLLEWKAASLARSSLDLEANWRNMWFAPALAVGTALLLSFAHPFALFAAAPLLLLWFLSPILAWWLSLPFVPRVPRLSGGQTLFLTRLARRTWAFFETQAGPRHNWLAPDTLQEQPQATTAPRTSPTGIGLGLLASLAARDFGFIAQAELLARVRAAFDSMALLERYRGHFYSGYDTRTLAPLAPRYVSTVESGNLAGYLLTLAAGLEQMADEPLAGVASLAGARATLDVIEEHGPLADAPADALARCRAALGPDSCRNADTLPGLADCLQAAAGAAAALLAALPDHADPQLRAWCERLDSQCRAAHADLLDLAPWMRAVHEYVLDASLTRIPTLRELAACAPPRATDASSRSLAALVEEGIATAQARMTEIAALAGQARAFGAMDFGCLYRRELGLLATGYQVDEERLDSDVHDVLASKARLASFIGIAQDQLPQEHWFALGRQLGIVHGDQVLLSRSGALAAYLAPLLLMPTWRNTLLDRSCHAAVRVQIDHARRHGIPWGMSDSSYHAVDAAMQYAYGAFGVPAMGLRRGRGDGLVVAPYASMLALMVEPEAACANLERLAQLGCLGEYGFYDAIDHTAAHLPHGRRHAVVRAFMARHQGMGLLALSSLLHDKPMQARFAADPQCRAASLLLQERAPKSGAFEAEAGEAEAPPSRPLPARTVTRPGAAQPEVQLLSNGRYHVMVTGDGGGYSRWGDLALTRWSADATGFDGGLACYLRDLDSGAAWPAAWQAAPAEPEGYAVRFLEERVELRRRDHGIELLAEIVVSPEDDVELRRMRIRNISSRARSIELTSHADVALAPPALDNAHPAFSKLFVQAEILAAHDAILCTRRPPGPGEAAPWLLHLMTVHGAGAGAASFETSRAHFVGREHGHMLPAALRQPGPLGGHDGAVLDPVVAIRRVLALAPGEEATVDLVLGAAGTRASALGLIDRYRDRAHADRLLELAWAHNQAVLRRLDAVEDDARLFARLAGSLLYPRRALRADPDLIAANGRGQSGLRAYGFTGEQALLLARIDDPANLVFVRQLLQAHAWWRIKGLRADLAIWIGGSDDTLHDGVRNLVASRVDAQDIACPGGVYVFSSDGVPHEDQLLMQAAASVVLTDARGSLRDQLRRAAAGKTALPPLLHGDTAPEAWSVRTPQPAPPGLVLDNGIGGFSTDGREYVIRTGPGRPTPAPWSNVLANPNFGSVVSESGTAHTWRGNAQAGRLTPWHNDPVRDTGGEAFYLRDEHSGVYWSATGAPRPSGGDYLARHGFGYSVFEHTAHGIHSELTSFVPLDAPLKYAVLKVRNDSSLPRRLSATGYVEWVLGEQRAASSMHVVTGRDDASGALLARSAYNGDMADSAAFFHVDAAQAAFTCDRMEFIGRGRSLAQPAALERAGLSGAAGAALDPCAALQVAFELQPGEQKELVFMLGAGSDVPGLVRRHRGAQAAGAALAKLRAWWDETLGAVRIATPDPALDVLANGWLPYQAIACRLWARASQYQSGGAQGFREGLQDAMALVHTRPQLLRAQLLACAAHQFVEGDVQHWWHPPGRRGARTRCADDHLWLPLAACRYIGASGDMAVLDEALPWLEGRALRDGEEAYVGEPEPSAQRGDLYEHCVRAIRHGLRFGAHGLPLMGSGDCNEAMDRVGIAGEGESVWLGFFMAEVLARFAELAERRADFGFATTCRAACQVLAARLEEHGWDGAWYRRAFFDDGTVLGTQDGAACRIDAMVQAWSVLSGVASPERAALAMAAFEARLVRRGHGLVQLLDPPFDGGGLDPGTIAAYPPGVRENGGQCTQAAVWAAMAYARLGQGERAWELLDLLNPIKHTASREDAGRYGLEPYVLADDVRAAAPHIGRGGWSWYTGSAGWMYRLIVESLLGVERRGERLVLAPQLPCGWPGFRMEYRYRSAVYEIEVRFAEAGALLVDGHAREGNTLDLADDGQRHRVELLLPRRHGPAMAAAREPTQSKSIT